MPTIVDVAAEAAHDEISNAVEHIKNNLASRSSPSANDDVSSPLFRDEVQRHEMRYLDRVLLAERPPATSNTRRSQSKGTAADCNLRKETGPSPPRIRPMSASVLRPCDRKNDDEECRKPRNRPPISNNIFLRSTPNPDSTIGHKLHEKISTFIRCDQPQKGKPIRRQKHARTAVPSRNKRRQIKHKFTQFTQLSSRKFINEMTRLGRRCALNLATVKDAINRGVTKAIASAHSMLEETSPARNDELPNAKKRRSDDIGYNENDRKVGTFAAIAAGIAKPRAEEERDVLPASQLRDRTSEPRVPPAFAFTPSWMSGGTEHMSSKVVSMARRTIRKGRVMKG